MRYPMILIVLSSSLLVGCVTFLEDLNANLKSVNDNLQGVNYKLRNAPGGGQTVMANASEKVCDQEAFQAGFRDQYILNWNQEVGNREATYQFLLKSHPNDPAARHNYSIYQGKRYSSKGTGNAMKYGIDMDSKGRIRNPCQSGSYAQGVGAGIKAVSTDLSALSEQEIERRY